MENAKKPSFASDKRVVRIISDKKEIYRLMSKSPETERKPKLFTSGKFFLTFIAILVGSCLVIIRDYLTKGRVSGVALGASVLAFVIGMIILIVLAWYANKPEE
jgi:hypothetical protein